jgi:hypothetical protein
VKAPSQRRALGTLFLILGAAFAGVAVTAAQAARDAAGLWIVAVAAAVLSAWLLGFALRALRKTPG